MQRNVYEFISKKTNDPIIERRTCRVSGEKFPIFQGDVDMLENLSPVIGGKKYDLPLPVISPETRHRLQLMWRNERQLYHATCDLTGKKTISRIAPEMGVPIYTNEAWGSDARDYTDYGLDYEGGDPLDYILKLARSTPYQDMIGSLSNVKNNALYTNYTADLVHCYLLFDSNRTQDSAYCTKARKSQSVFDCLHVIDCEYCYACTDCSDMYGSTHCYDCSGCTDSDYLIDCHGCSHCIGCVNLTQKEYHLFNEPVTKEVFEEYKKEMIEQGGCTDERWLQLQKHLIRKATHQLNSEKCIGENISGSSRVFCSSNIIDGQDLRRCDSIGDATQDCRGVTSYGHASARLYNCAQVGRYSSQLWCCASIGKGENLFYCIDTKKSRNCFGCVNMKQVEYCIFNKQYTKEEYEELLPVLLRQMQERGTWGFFLPTTHSVIPYNDTVAHDIYPPQSVQYSDGRQEVYDENGSGVVVLHGDDAFIVDALLDLGGEETLSIKWRTQESEINVPDDIVTLQGKDLPNNIDVVDDDILEKAIICEVSGRPFRIVSMELDFYRKHTLPLPRKHPDVRHQERLAKRPGRELYLRECDKTGEEILSVYPEGVPFSVYSEEAYRQEIYG